MSCKSLVYGVISTNQVNSLMISDFVVVAAAIQANMKSSKGTLVVCPASLVHHWKKEIEKRVKPLKLTVCLYHGQTREKSPER